MNRACLRRSGGVLYLLALLTVPAAAYAAEPTEVERQRTTMVAATVIVAVETALLAGLIVMVRRRRDSQRQLEHSDRLKSAILASLPAPVAVLDHGGTIIAANDAGAGVGCENGLACASGQDGCAAFPREACPGALEALAAVTAVCTGTSSGAQREYACDARDGQRWFLMTAEPL